MSDDNQLTNLPVPVMDKAERHVEPRSASDHSCGGHPHLGGGDATCRISAESAGTTTHSEVVPASNAAPKFNPEGAVSEEWTVRDCEELEGGDFCYDGKKEYFRVHDIPALQKIAKAHNASLASLRQELGEALKENLHLATENLRLFHELNPPST